MYKHHIFVCESCQYETEKGPSDPALGKILRKNISSKVKEMFSTGDVCVTGSGCLGQCEQGISSVIYPKGEWINGLRPGDEIRIIEKLTKR
ncbi:MAG: (2Fe-2S) ferredoxin domain-containing protein [Bdellovibrio sp.]|nr:(2Fe-2S) ferredoxin domain-containing protein [Bdellovibrio sp.]